MTLDEFNLVCYVSMYSCIHTELYYLNNLNNPGNSFLNYVSVINIYLKKKKMKLN